MIGRVRKVNYLNNRDILREIHKSKCTYSSFLDDKYSMYDAIVMSLDEIDSKYIKAIRETKANNIIKNIKHDNKQVGVKEFIEPIDPESLPLNELVFRLVSFEHIPIDEVKKANAENKERNGKKRVLGDDRTKLNFVPFSHYVLKDWTVNRLGNFKELEFIEVGRSHWIGGLGNGYFSHKHGDMTPKLADMFIKLVTKYATRSNWRGYSYNEDMRGQALMQLSQVGLQFNEAKSSNPFSYYTETVTNSFTRVLNIEKQSQNIRDDLLIQGGSAPSSTRQIADDPEMKKLERDTGYEKPKPLAKRGRKKLDPKAKKAA